ncbi:cell division protein FtsA [Anaeromicropila herbilytica]|uniref:Cell division protein FtsA n=1 Tax=Anaeromicropila herbilytica TaxID=2785025 RepID=A0A7R7EJZ9_9FIRM|nr:cell division FtsA domain-containing protein [Anaeromicropila herbilytica]BCN30535.1 cell division protein FtsA [Anaeromicropila herbilytica]
MEDIRYPEHLVFGLDIGTRSIVGTVGYKENKNGFKVVAQYVKEHETRAMLDGQIHDIPKVAETIAFIKKELEKEINRPLTEVCIAAAGRVLKTITVEAEYEFQNETIITDEHVHSLDLIGVEKAYDEIRELTKNENTNFYCVGYSVITYYLNEYAITNLEGHKANKIATKLLATFLPDEVIDSLYTAVERAGLVVANLTLEPIAAITVAIPEAYRMLNIALVDVGAGTSDICITKDGSIIAYGMIPFAGDEITETIAQKYLVDFQTAEKMKQSCIKKKSITYKDIMGLSHKVMSTEINETVNATVRNITQNIADKIIELNGDKSVSAVFVVGGGGKMTGFISSLAEYLNLPNERVALRGEEVLKEIEFMQPKVKKDSLLVTPIGICLNYYDQKNNFIFVQVNGERVKLYDNSRLTVADAVIGVGMSNELLFPRRGKAINFTLDGEKRLVRGELGEAAIVKCNDKVVGISSPIEQNDKIEVIESTVGKDATYEVLQLPEYQNNTIEFIFNSQKIVCPKFVKANEELVSEYYQIKDEDAIEILDYYTLEQVLSFMDIPYHDSIRVNNTLAHLEDKIYANFTVQYEIDNQAFQKVDVESISYEQDFAYEEGSYTYDDYNQNNSNQTEATNQNVLQEDIQQSKNDTKQDVNQQSLKQIEEIVVVVNGQAVLMNTKKQYILVDVLDFYHFDMSVSGGNSLVIRVNGEDADFTTPVKDKDNIELFWK